MSGTAPYHTQVFSPLPGRCFCWSLAARAARPTAWTRPSGGLATQKPA
jgi:hypothetical protein